MNNDEDNPLKHDLDEYEGRCLSCAYYYDGSYKLERTIPKSARLEMLERKPIMSSFIGIPQLPTCYKVLNMTVFSNYKRETDTENRKTILAEASCQLRDEWKIYLNAVPPDVSWQNEQTIKIKQQNQTLIIYNKTLAFLTIALVILTGVLILQAANLLPLC